MNHVDFVTAAKMYFANYANFKGRSTRAEYWWATLMVFILSTISNFISPVVYGLVALALIIPNLAILTRRFHDTGRSGWWVVVLCAITLGAYGFGVLPLFQSAITYANDPEALKVAMATLVETSSVQIASGLMICAAVGIVTLVLTILPSGPDNKYGPNPYGNNNQ